MNLIEEIATKISEMQAFNTPSETAEAVLAVVKDNLDYEAATREMLEWIEWRGVPDEYVAKETVLAALRGS